MWQIKLLRDVPVDHHVVRVCRPKHVDKGQITPQAFEPVQDEGYLSVHWLEYLSEEDGLPEGFQLLRQFLVQSRFGDLKLQKSGKLAAIPVQSLTTISEPSLAVAFRCKHVPREAPSLASGVDRQISDHGFDPHSGVYSLPWKGAELLAVQQYLISKIIHEEPSKV
ncbi:hypothetical protein [Paraburkholderia fungorum]|uniref:hypothetical protein n=1 Tax=Paraburkholderia fungorum TaxID=134537 RepID=UPI003877F242